MTILILILEPDDCVQEIPVFQVAKLPRHMLVHELTSWRQLKFA